MMKFWHLLRRWGSLGGIMLQSGTLKCVFIMVIVSLSLVFGFTFPGAPLNWFARHSTPNLPTNAQPQQMRASTESFTRPYSSNNGGFFAPTFPGNGSSFDWSRNGSEYIEARLRQNVLKSALGTINEVVREIETDKQEMLQDDEFDKLVTACSDLIVFDSVDQSLDAPPSLFKLRHARCLQPRYLEVPTNEYDCAYREEVVHFKRCLLKAKLENMSDALYSQFNIRYRGAADALCRYLMKFPAYEEQVATSLTVDTKEAIREWFCKSRHQELFNSAREMNLALGLEAAELEIWIAVCPEPFWKKCLDELNYTRYEGLQDFLGQRLQHLIRTQQRVIDEYWFYLRLITDLILFSEVSPTSPVALAGCLLPLDNFITKSDSQEAVQYKQYRISELLKSYIVSDDYVSCQSRMLMEKEYPGLLADTANYILDTRTHCPQSVSYATKIAAESWLAGGPWIHE
jgi:hypothetical protein